MSHIPASKMPHPHAHGDDLDGRPEQRDSASGHSGGAEGEAALSSAAPGTATGARAGSDADTTARAAGSPESASAQPAVDGAVTAETPDNVSSSRLSPAGYVMVALGGLAAVAGIVAAMLPLLRDDQPEPKSKKRARKSKAA